MNMAYAPKDYNNEGYTNQTDSKMCRITFEWCSIVYILLLAT